MLWSLIGEGRVPVALSPTVERRIYFKLPVAGTRYHWHFSNRADFLAGELALRISNARRGRDDTLVVFRHGRISDGWRMIDGDQRDGSAYFGFSSEKRFRTTAGDSLTLTFVAPKALPGIGPYAAGTLRAGRWIATGSYRSMYGGTLSPIRDLVNIGESPIAFLGCWDNSWPLIDRRNQGWMGIAKVNDNEPNLLERVRPPRGEDGRRCNYEM